MKVKKPQTKHNIKLKTKHYLLNIAANRSLKGTGHCLPALLAECLIELQDCAHIKKNTVLLMPCKGCKANSRWKFPSALELAKRKYKAENREGFGFGSGFGIFYFCQINYFSNYTGIYLHSLGVASAWVLAYSELLCVFLDLEQILFRIPVQLSWSQ